MDSMYLENIEEFINDNKNIVTYRFLSLSLKVPSNVAKQMLYHYYEKHKGSCELSATYLISGIKYDEHLKQDALKVCVVQEENLESVKSKLKKIYSLHIYSLQRGRLKDLSLLYSTDFDSVKENISSSSSYSSIICPAASVRPDSTSQDKPKLENCKEPGQPAVQKVEVPRREDSLENKENKANNGVTRSKPAPKKEAKGALASMFANQTKKLATLNSISEKDAKPDVIRPPEKTSTLSGGLKKGSLSTFLTKGNTPLAESLKKEHKHNVKADKTPDPVKMEVESEEEKVLIKEKQNQKETKKKQVVKKKPASKGKRKSSEPLSDESNKRRRIITWDSSSESSNEEEEMMEECPIPSPQPKPQKLLDSDDEDVIPATPQSSGSCDVTKSRARKKKLVDKTFLDEDGFLVTKKESVFVSDSDEENPIPSPKEKKTSPQTESGTVKRAVPPAATSRPSKKSAKKVASPVKTKQATIMSFFKKK